MQGSNKRAERLVVQALPQKFRPRVEWGVIEVETQVGVGRLRPIWVSGGQRADVRRVLSGLSGQGEAEPVLVAYQFAPGAERMLEETETSWVDARGRAEVRTSEHSYLSVTDLADAVQRRELRWSPSAMKTAEVLLQKTTQVGGDSSLVVPTTAELSRLTGTSSVQASRTLQEFDGAGYTVKRGASRGPSARREVVDRGALLSDWSRARLGIVTAEQQFATGTRDPDEIWRAFQTTAGGVPTVQSGAAAANRIRPLLTNVGEVLAYVPEGEFQNAIDRLIATGVFTPVSEGGRLIVKEAPHYLFGHASENGLAPLPRIYRDTLAIPIRGEDAAEQLREATIGF